MLLIEHCVYCDHAYFFRLHLSLVRMSIIIVYTAILLILKISMLLIVHCVSSVGSLMWYIHDQCEQDVVHPMICTPATYMARLLVFSCDIYDQCKQDVAPHVRYNTVPTWDVLTLYKNGVFIHHPLLGNSNYFIMLFVDYYCIGNQQDNIALYFNSNTI